MPSLQGRNVIGNNTFHGPIPSLAVQPLDILLLWVGRESRFVKGRYSTQKYQLPPEMLRKALYKALYNALFNFQHSMPGAVKVALYFDRLEYLFQGTLAGRSSRQRIGMEPATSAIR